MNITLSNISFSYDPLTKVFEHHNFKLEEENNSNTSSIFAIIGPSHTGKTTLISIIGGQLKPKTGNVIINDQDIYTISENQRRALIGIQLQKDIPIHGTVKYHLCFGLFMGPDRECMVQQEVIEEVLRKVGLWKFFYERRGLETSLGIDGIRLTPDQRQRLHFASLYLRALHYKPSVVLIDEPNYTMDDISEKAITKMIQELSHHSTIIVVARRINTLQSVQGILDTSLIQTRKDLSFMSHEELLSASKYYNYLQNGSVSL